MRFFLGWAALLAIGSTPGAEQLTVTAPTMVQMPLLASRSLSQPLSQPGIGVTGANAILVWNERAGDAPGAGGNGALPNFNIVFSRIDGNGIPLDHPGRAIVSRGAAQDPVGLTPAGSSYYMIYGRASNVTTLSPETVLTRISVDGAPYFAPVVITTNTVKTYRATSNGRTLMFVYDGRSPEPSALLFQLFDLDGKLISKGSVPGSDYPLSYDLASDGTDYLLVWQSRVAPFLRATRFSGNSGGHVTATVSTNNVAVSALGYGSSGYLLATSSLPRSMPGLLELDRDGKILASGSPTNFLINAASAIFGEGDGWNVVTVFDSTARTMRVTPVGGGALRSQPDPSALANGMVNMAAMPIENFIRPFGGPGKYLATRWRGVSVVPPADAPMRAPKAYAIQNYSRVVASPFGYLATWREASGDGAALNAMRFAKDGTRLDAQPLVITNRPTDPPSVVFDGSDYLVGWLQVDYLARHLARIAPTGSANMRTQTINVRENPYPFEIVANQSGRTYLTTWGAGDALSLHLVELSPTGGVASENLLHGQSVVTDGRDFYSIGAEAGEVYTWKIEQGAIPQEVNRKVSDAGSSAYGFSLPNAFAVVWIRDGGPGWNYAYFTNGVEQFRSALPSGRPPKIAANQERLVVTSYPTANRNRVLFRSTHLATGEIVETTADFGSHTDLNFASAGGDFFGVTDSIGVAMQYVGSFWATHEPAPAFNIARGPSGLPQASLSLQPTRSYRIETSSDLIHWQLVEIVTARDRFEVPAPQGAHTFVRAILIPE